MRRNVIETVLGGVVLIVAAVFLVFAYNSADLRPVAGYRVSGQFGAIDGLTVGSDVRVAGVKVGSVVGESIDRGGVLRGVAGRQVHSHRPGRQQTVYGRRREIREDEGYRVAGGPARQGDLPGHGRTAAPQLTSRMAPQTGHIYRLFMHRE
jgi:hypothetical protein